MIRGSRSFLLLQVIACEPLGCLVDQKGNKITGFDSDKKQVTLQKKKYLLYFKSDCSPIKN